MSSDSRGIITLPTLIVVAAFGLTAVALDRIHAPSTLQLAAAAGGAGVCEPKYKQCLQLVQSRRKTLPQCENEFQNCVRYEQKCAYSSSLGAENFKCNANADCQTHCTENWDSKTGLLTCCMGGAKHVNTCKDRTDGKCITGPQRGTPQEPHGNAQSGMPELPQEGSGGEGGGRQQPKTSDANVNERIDDAFRKVDELTKNPSKAYGDLDYALTREAQNISELAKYESSDVSPEVLARPEFRELSELSDMSSNLRVLPPKIESQPHFTSSDFHTFFPNPYYDGAGTFKDQRLSQNIEDISGRETQSITVADPSIPGSYGNPLKPRTSSFMESTKSVAGYIASQATNLWQNFQGWFNSSSR